MRIAAADSELVITEDGTPLAPDAVSDALEFGPPVPSGDSEMSLPNIRLLARVQGWTTDIDTAYTDGVRIRISGVSVLESGESSTADERVST